MTKSYLNLKNINLINLCTIFVVLIPPALVSGPFIPDFFYQFVVFYFYINVLKKKFHLFSNKVF